MKRGPRNPNVVEASKSVSQIQLSEWMTSEEAARFLGKFEKRTGKPSVGAIRNMIYRKQITARKFFGRIMISRAELSRRILLSPQIGR